MVDAHEGDRQVLAAMRQHGADLRKAAHTIHYLYFPSRSAAESAAGDLRAQGYEVQVDRAAAPPFWKRLFSRPKFVCIAENHAVPNESAVFATSNKMSRLAAKFGGEYDGWEASIEK
jgi:hypothetical protein